MVISFRPKSELLSRYVKDFSTFERGCDLNINYAAFPAVGPALALFRNADLLMEGRNLKITPTKDANHNTVVLGKYTAPVVITYSGFLEEISVNFTALGINYFFDAEYRDLAPENFQHLREHAWLEFVPRIFSITDPEQQIDLFEDFLLQRFRHRRLDRLQRCVDLFSDPESDHSVAEVAEAAGLNEKTMRRQFNRFVGCSPVMFKRIVRFRNAIDARRLDDQYDTLTRLCHDSLFYDSSHFGREYRLFTGRNPKLFFDDVSFLGNSEYPYIFL